MSSVYQLTAKQIFILALVSGVVASILVGGGIYYEVNRTRTAEAITAINAPPSAAGETLPDEENNTEVYREASPSVVNITSTTYVQDFFSVYPSSDSGSGSIISDQGHIVTNYHVIGRAQKLDVSLADGSHYPAEVVGVDPYRDLAVIKVAAPKSKLKPLKFGTSKDLVVGQKVLAIGNPFGLDRTLTTGVVSGLGRPLREPTGQLIEGVIQTDASINPGNSGGPLLNSRGEMIGINTAIFNPNGGGSIGIGFAIPVDAAKAIISDILAYGRVRRPWMGASYLAVTQRLADYLGLSVSQGLMVMSVVPGSPTEQAGIRGGDQELRLGFNRIVVGGDIITRIDDRPIRTQEDIDAILNQHKPGDVVEVEVTRGSRKLTVKMTLQEPPPEYRR